MNIENFERAMSVRHELASLEMEEAIKEISQEVLDLMEWPVPSLRGLEALKPEKTNPAFLSATWVYQAITKPTEKEAVANMLAENYTLLFFYFDLSSGAGYITGSLAAAEHGLNRRMGKSTPTNFNPDRDYENQANRAADLLSEDPSGFLLVDEVFKWVNGEENRYEINPLSSELKSGIVIKGAEFAVKLYKSTYPIAKEVVVRGR